MGKVLLEMSVAVDGYDAGPDISLETRRTSSDGIENAPQRVRVLLAGTSRPSPCRSRTRDRGTRPSGWGHTGGSTARHSSTGRRHATTISGCVPTSTTEVGEHAHDAAASPW